MFDDLIKAWFDYRAASARMTAGPVPAWPWNRQDEAFIENQRLRDRVQGRGMRFAHLWRMHHEDIRAVVDDHRDRFVRYHTPDPKTRELLDPTLYMQSISLMPEIIEMVQAKTI